MGSFRYTHPHAGNNNRKELDGRPGWPSWATENTWSGTAAHCHTMPLCSWRVSSAWPFRRSHTFTVLSTEVDTTRAASATKAACVTAPPWSRSAAVGSRRQGPPAPPPRPKKGQQEGKPAASASSFCDDASHI